MPTAPAPDLSIRRMTGDALSARTRALLWLPLLISITVAGCSSEGPEPDPDAAGDAGPVVVENFAPTWTAGQEWSVGTTPSLDITTLAGDPNEPLEFIRGAARLSDGRIVVANGGTNEIRTYGPDGQFMFTRGGAGTSPDEFRQIGDVLAFGGDTVAVNDWGSGRVVVYKPSAEWARDFRLPDLGPAYVPLLHGRFADGSILVATGDRIDPATTDIGVVRKPVLFIRASAEGAALDTIEQGKGDEMFVIERIPGAIQAAGLPFGRTTEASLTGDRIHIGNSDTYEISSYTADGELQQVIRKQHDPVAVTVESFRTLADQRVARIADETIRAERRQELLDMPIPETMPAFGLILGDSEGYIWVQDYATPDDELVEWNVFAADGTLLGPVSLPARLRVKQIGVNFVLGLVTDELGIEHVQLYSLTRS